MTGEPESRRRWGCLPVAIALLAVLLLLVTGVVFIALMRPPIFTPPSLDDTEAQQRAKTFEKNFVAEFTRVRDDEEPWGVRIREEDFNAWLWYRFPAWVAHARGENTVASDPLLQVTIDSERMRFATDSFVVGLTTSVQNGRAVVIPGTGSSVGRLPLPGVIASEWVMGSAELRSLPQALLNDESGGLDGRHVFLPEDLELPDGRMVELLEIQLEDGEAILVFRTRGP